MILLPLHEWVHTCSQQAEHGNVMKYPLFLLQAPYQRRLVVHFRGLGSGFGVFEDNYWNHAAFLRGTGAGETCATLETIVTALKRWVPDAQASLIGEAAAALPGVSLHAWMRTCEIKKMTGEEGDSFLRIGLPFGSRYPAVMVEYAPFAEHHWRGEEMLEPYRVFPDSPDIVATTTFLYWRAALGGVHYCWNEHWILARLGQFFDVQGNPETIFGEPFARFSFSRNHASTISIIWS